MSSIFIVSPISGGTFVSQTAILTHIRRVVPKVDAYFGNSGGAIANLIAMKYNGNRKSIEKVLYQDIQFHVYKTMGLQKPPPFNHTFD